MNLPGILWTEIRQNKKITLTLLLVSFFLGTAAHLMLETNEALESLVQPVQWSADMAIVPKGISLSDLATELQTDQVHALLPEALFVSTVQIVQGAVQLTAVLPGKDSKGPFVMGQGDPIMDFTPWNLPTKPWAAQSEHSTPEWGTRVMAAAFASGAKPQLQKLKELIDRKTVAQALWIKDVQRSEIQLQQSLSSLASVIEFILLFSLMASLGLAASWLYANHLQTALCLTDLGWSRRSQWSLRGLLIATLFLIPMGAGFGCVPQNEVSALLSTTHPL